MFVPAFAEHRVRQQECHVDADGCRRGAYHNVALLAYDHVSPEGPEILGHPFYVRHNLVGRLIEQTQIGNQAAEDFAPDDLAFDAELENHADEAEYDDTDDRLDHDLEYLDALASCAVGHRNCQADCQEHRAGDHLAGYLTHYPVSDKSGQQVLSQRRGPECELRQGPNEVRHHRGEQPAPA